MAWTNVIYKQFRKCNPCWKHTSAENDHVLIWRSRQCVHFQPAGQPTSSNLRKKPSKTSKSVTIGVTRIGKVKHLEGETCFRPANFNKRGKIAKALINGVSKTYYKRLSDTPSAELMAGTLSHALTKEVIKAVSAEVKRSTWLHHDIVMGLILMQEILKETDMKFTFCPGYIQHLQVDPFGVHLYTETGLIILLEHLRKNGQITLFLDANDGVVQRPPNQQKRVLYYAEGTKMKANAAS